MVTVTEGEIDALSVSQLFQNKWPVVSVPIGASGALKAFQNNLEWLEKFQLLLVHPFACLNGRQLQSLLRTHVK